MKDFKIEKTLLTIQDSKGVKLLEIPVKEDTDGEYQYDYTPGEIFALIAEQTRSYWGEQIAGEILAKCENNKETNTSEFGSYEVVGCLEFIQLEDNAYYEVTCTHAEDAAIARGK